MKRLLIWLAYLTVYMYAVFHSEPPATWWSSLWVNLFGLGLLVLPLWWFIGNWRDPWRGRR